MHFAVTASSIARSYALLLIASVDQQPVYTTHSPNSRLQMRTAITFAALAIFFMSTETFVRDLRLELEYGLSESDPRHAEKARLIQTFDLLDASGAQTCFQSRYAIRSPQNKMHSLRFAQHLFMYMKYHSFAVAAHWAAMAMGMW